MEIARSKPIEFGPARPTESSDAGSPMAWQEKLVNDELARAISKAARIEGAFVLRSGQIVHHYFDKYRFEANPDLLRQIAARMMTCLPRETEVLAGLELGGIPLVTAMSLESGLPVAFVRKQPRTYDTRRAIEGQDVAGRRTVIIEDVISTGGTVARAASQLTSAGATLLGVICAIWRGPEPPAIAAEPDLPVTAVFTERDLAILDD
jgi:orotate phosphoribosyltransferase